MRENLTSLRARRSNPDKNITGLPRSFQSLAMTMIILLVSCSFAPNYKRPEMPIPTEYKESKDWKPATPADDKPRGKWWEAFNNAELNDLEEKALKMNQDLKAAYARYQDARAAASYARADYFPTITGNATMTRNGTSSHVANESPVKIYNDYALTGDATYELDFWGRVRNNVATASFGAEATKADYGTAQLSIAAELAVDYFALRADDFSQAILDDTVTAYQKALDLTQSRFKGGVASQTDVDQSILQLQNAKTQAAEMHLKRSQLEHAIAVLVGEMPSSFTLQAVPLASAMPSLGVNMPSELLERRPDIAAAERRAEAANAQIGIARAAWFPRIDLLGSFGVESVSTGNLISAPSQVWTLGPSALFAVFDVGHLTALNQEARAAYEEAAARYRQAVLNAYREVEDNIVALKQLEQENITQTAATDAAQRVLQQEQDRYTGGIVNYLNVVEAQNNALQAKLAYIDIKARQLTAAVQLIKALGGGWTESAKEVK